MDPQISIELNSGRVVAWNEFAASQDVCKQNIEMPSQFIHLQGYLIPILGLREMSMHDNFRKMKIELKGEVWLSYHEAVWSLSSG